MTIIIKHSIDEFTEMLRKIKYFHCEEERRNQWELAVDYDNIGIIADPQYPNHVQFEGMDKPYWVFLKCSCGIDEAIWKVIGKLDAMSQQQNALMGFLNFLQSLFDDHEHTDDCFR
jgi:hypothetical protein